MRSALSPLRLAALSTLAFAAAAAADTVRQDDQAAPAAARQENAAPESQRPGERLICRQIDKTGSRTGRQRICMTREEWRAVGNLT